MPHSLIRSCLAALALIGAAALQGAELPQHFTATYAVEWHGISAGTSTLELMRTGMEEYTYRSRNVARGVFRMAFPETITQTSVFKIVNAMVTPVSYQADDGSKDTSRDIALNFDWKDMRVSGTAEQKPVSATLEPGVQDSLSVQIALMRELLAGRSPASFQLIDKDEVKEYRYTREGTVVLDTPLGKLETVIYTSRRASASAKDRVTRLWLSPEHFFLPVRAERVRGGKVEFVMRIRDLTPQSAALAAARR